MYKCTMDKGQMIFTDDKGIEYIPSGKTLTDMREVVSEHDLIIDILADHQWAFPVIEKLQERKRFLLQNLFDLYKEFYNGSVIRHAEVAETASAEGGRSSSPGGDGGSGKKKKAQGQV